MRYQLLKNTETGEQDLHVVIDGETFHANSETHAQFEEILDDVLADIEPDVALFNVENAISAKFEVLSERLAVANGVVYFDGDPLHNVFTEHLLRMIAEGTVNWQPLIPFFDKVQQNPEAHSRENLYRWLAAERFTIDEDGNIVGYKGLNENETSIHTGPAIVDGEPMNGHIPYRDGSVVTMPRSKVQHDPSRGCSTGLHVGTWSYANFFGSLVKLVKVNPRDVVSVPTDSGDAKMRASRVEVVRTVTEPLTAAVGS